MAEKDKRTFSQALYGIQREHPWMKMSRIVYHLAKEFPQAVIEQFVKNRFISYAKSRQN